MFFELFRNGKLPGGWEMFRRNISFSPIPKWKLMQWRKKALFITEFFLGKCIPAMWWTVVPNIVWQAQCHICIGFAPATFYHPDPIKHLPNLRKGICTQISQGGELWLTKYCFGIGPPHTHAHSENDFKNMSNLSFCDQKVLQKNCTAVKFTSCRWSYFAGQVLWVYSAHVIHLLGIFWVVGS